MNTVIGKENINAKGIYYDLFTSLVEIVNNNPDIKVEAIIDVLKNDFNEGDIKESIRYLISKKFFSKHDGITKFEKTSLKLLRKPNIQLIDDNKPIYPRIVITLPPYDFYGIKNSLKESGIEFFSIKDGIKEMFECAEKSIDICSPFIEYKGIEEFLPLLTSKSRVKMRILSRQIDKNDKNNRYFDIKRIVDYFEEKNCKIEIRNYHYQAQKSVESSTHAKFIICDNEVAYVGSGELRKNSFEKNFELGLILKGDKVETLSLIFENLFSVSNEIIF